MRLIKNILVWFMRVLLLAICAAISVFLLASGYESLYSRSLPLVHTLDPVTLRPVDGTYDLRKAFDQSKEAEDTAVFGTFGRPTTLKMSGRTKKIDIVQAIRPNQHEWLARANTLHLLTPTPARHGNIGIILLYGRSSFRTIGGTNTPTEGTNLFIDTDHNWRYVYKITSLVKTSNSTPYVPADNGANSKLVIVCDDAGQKTSIIIEANLLSVQGIEQ